MGNSGVFIDVWKAQPSLPHTLPGPNINCLKNHILTILTAPSDPGVSMVLAQPKILPKKKPLGQWNQSRIKQVNGKIGFYLNGVLTAEKDLTSPAWLAMVSKSAFKNFPEFGRHTRGHIALQEWARGISFRNIKIKEL